MARPVVDTSRVPRVRFAKLSVDTVAATSCSSRIGGFVRSMAAGSAATNWRTCTTRSTRPSSLAWHGPQAAWIEHSHRLASAMIALIVSLAIAARITKQPPRRAVVCYWLVPAVLSQAVGGALVVW